MERTAGGRRASAVLPVITGVGGLWAAPMPDLAAYAVVICVGAVCSAAFARVPPPSHAGIVGTLSLTRWWDFWTSLLPYV